MSRDGNKREKRSLIGRIAVRTAMIVAVALLATVSVQAPALGASPGGASTAADPAPRITYAVSPSVDRILAEQAAMMNSAHRTPQASQPGDDLRGISMTAVPLPRATIMGAGMLILMAVVAMVRQSRRRNASLD